MTETELGSSTMGAIYWTLTETEYLITRGAMKTRTSLVCLVSVYTEEHYESHRNSVQVVLGWNQRKFTETVAALGCIKLT